MRKFLTMALALIMIFTMAFGLTACGDKEENNGMPNPMVEYNSLEEINEIIGCNLCHPAVMGVTNEKFFTIDCVDFIIAEYQFELNGTPFKFRCAAASEDISGVYVGDGTAFADTAEEGILNLDGESYVARWFTLDGQYCLYVSDTSNCTIDAFEAIVEELEDMTLTGLDKPTAYADLEGSYEDLMSQRATMEIVDKGDYVEIEVHWSSSYATYTRWTMTGRLGDEGLLYYEDCEKDEITMVENADGTISETAVKEYDGGSGYFSPSYDDLVTIFWNGAEEADCQECEFRMMEFYDFAG